MFRVYILQSDLNGRYYIGYTSDLEKRLVAHNSGSNRSTKPFIPWQIVYTEEYSTKEEAYKREQQIKKYKGGRTFKALLES